MEFLRRLAPPSLTGDRSRATPWVAPRFAGEAPLRSVPGAALAEPAPTGGDPAEAFVSARAAARQTWVASPAGSEADAARVIRDVAGSERLAEAPADRRPHAPTAPQAQTPPSAIDSAAVGALPPVRGPLGGALRSPAERADASTPTTQFAHPAHPVAPSMPPPRRPLSQRALDARLSAVAPMPPVIHVTIDRIDVRAPTVPPRAAEPPRPRRDAASVPLADYLRGKVGA